MIGNDDTSGLDTTFNMVTPFTIAEREQAVARIERYGQTATIQHIYCDATATTETKKMLPNLALVGHEVRGLKDGKRTVFAQNEYDDVVSATQLVKDWL